MNKQTILIIAIILLNITTAFAQKEIIVNAGFNNTKLLELKGENSGHHFKGRNAYLVNIGYLKNSNYGTYKLGFMLSYMKKNTYVDVSDITFLMDTVGQKMEHKLSYLNLYYIFDRQLYLNENIRVGVPIKAFGGICFSHCMEGMKFSGSYTKSINECDKDINLVFGLDLGLKLEYGVTDKINLLLEPSCEFDLYPPIQNNTKTIALSYIVTAGVSFAL